MVYRCRFRRDYADFYRNTIVQSQEWTEIPLIDALMTEKGPDLGAGAGDGDEDDLPTEDEPGDFGLKRKHRYCQDYAKPSPQTFGKYNVDTYFKPMREDMMNHNHYMSNKDPSNIPDTTALKKCNPKTSYYEDDLLMEPEPTPKRFPSSVVTKRFVVDGSTQPDAITLIDRCVEMPGECKLMPAVNYPKHEVELVRDVGRILPEKTVRLKRQLGPDEDSSMDPPKKLIRLTRP